MSMRKDARVDSSDSWVEGWSENSELLGEWLDSQDPDDPCDFEGLDIFFMLS